MGVKKLGIFAGFLLLLIMVNVGSVSAVLCDLYCGSGSNENVLHLHIRRDAPPQFRVKWINSTSL